MTTTPTGTLGSSPVPRPPSHWDGSGVPTSPVPYGTSQPSHWDDPSRPDWDVPAVPSRQPSRWDDPSRPVPPSPLGDGDAELAKLVRRTGLVRQAFYCVVLLVALAGQVTGAVERLRLPLYAAIPAVAALELGGMVVLGNADVRRRLGERAVVSRALSAGIAAWAVAFNWLAHTDHLLGGFFAGMSALGYLVWVMHTENSRRDRLRATGDLPPTTPVYELAGHWLRHPLLTLRAKSLAKADPRLGLYDSIAQARADQRRERREAAIANVLRRKIRKAVDPRTADIALAVLDLDEIGVELGDRIDKGGIVDLIAADLTPDRIAPTVARQRAAEAERAAEASRDASASQRDVPPSRPPGGGTSRPTKSSPRPSSPGGRPVPSRDGDVPPSRPTVPSRDEAVVPSRPASQRDGGTTTVPVPSRPDRPDRPDRPAGDEGRDDSGTPGVTGAYRDEIAKVAKVPAYANWRTTVLHDRAVPSVGQIQTVLGDKGKGRAGRVQKEMRAIALAAAADLDIMVAETAADRITT